jgi:hypothetical protein
MSETGTSIRRAFARVVSFVPRRSPYIIAHLSLLARLGSRAFERTEPIRDRDGRLSGLRHIGWRWPCDCSSFARPEGDYLWIPCRAHDAVRQGAER